jgi:uncharacterized SAM-binding protein YcdF (DUF218 family)
MHGAFLSMKFLVNPFLWYLLLQFAGLLALQRRTTGRSRTLLRMLLLLTPLLAVVSTPLTSRVLETTLLVPPTASSADVPAFIFVLGGGYHPGVIPDEDILVAESQRRVLHGLTLSRRYPNARMVFSGAAYEYKGIRKADRLVQLMAEAAQIRGVPASAVLLESRSGNTREHPVEALTLPGVTSTTPIALVTSGWHMRRAQREFCRYFKQVQPYPVLEVQRPVGWQDFIPDADTLDANTNLLREWVGMLWYAILGNGGHALKC